MNLPSLPRPNRFTIMLVIAVILAGVAAFLTVHYLKGRESQIKAEYQHKITANKVDVVVPIHNLKAGTVANGQNMAARSVPESVIYPTTILASEWSRYTGRVLTHNIEGGRPVLVRDFSKAYNGNFAAKIPVNMRAMTIEVDGVNSLAGLIRPGNRVDVLLIRSGKASAGSSSSNLLPLLHRTLVLATGHESMFTPVLARQQENNDSGAQSSLDNYGTITLEVTPEQAAQLALAKQAGNLRIVLCPTRNAVTEEEIPSLTVGDLGSGTPTQKSLSSIQYIIGSGGDESISSNFENNQSKSLQGQGKPNTSNENSHEMMKKAMSGLNSILDLDKHAATLNNKG